MISDFQQLLDLNGVQYITEGDGRLIADCPLCSEDGRQSKLTIFPDGNLSCVRFASVGGEELKRHNTEIKKIWQAGSDDADSLTSILFDGTLTLAIRPEGKSCFVQATNCNKVLHIDNFNPTIAAKRTAFVNKLPGYSDEQKNEIREALVELAVRARATQAVIDNVRNREQ
ncbi:MAG: hypothetical protein H0X08_09515 [Blastocatellia bacterium]|nr:hypothetical protein [Blastocatellia bacterium]